MVQEAALTTKANEAGLYDENPRRDHIGRESAEDEAFLQLKEKENAVLERKRNHQERKRPP